MKNYPPFPSVPWLRGGNYLQLRAATTDLALSISNSYATSATWLGDYDWDIRALPDLAGIATSVPNYDIMANGLIIVPFSTAAAGEQILEIIAATTDLAFANDAAFTASTAYKIAVQTSRPVRNVTDAGATALFSEANAPFYVPFRDPARYINLRQHPSCAGQATAISCQIWVDLGGNTKYSYR